MDSFLLDLIFLWIIIATGKNPESEEDHVPFKLPTQYILINWAEINL